MDNTWAVFQWLDEHQSVTQLLSSHACLDSASVLHLLSSCQCPIKPDSVDVDQIVNHFNGLVQAAA